MNCKKSLGMEDDIAGIVIKAIRKISNCMWFYRRLFNQPTPFVKIFTLKTDAHSHLLPQSVEK